MFSSEFHDELVLRANNSGDLMYIFDPREVVNKFSPFLPMEREFGFFENDQEVIIVASSDRFTDRAVTIPAEVLGGLNEEKTRTILNFVSPLVGLLYETMQAGDIHFNDAEPLASLLSILTIKLELGKDSLGDVIDTVNQIHEFVFPRNVSGLDNLNGKRNMFSNMMQYAHRKVLSELASNEGGTADFDATNGVYSYWIPNIYGDDHYTSKLANLARYLEPSGASVTEELSDSNDNLVSSRITIPVGVLEPEVA